VCLFTFAFQALLLAFVLAYADRHYAGRGWINLGIVLALYVLWYATGELTRLVRKDSEGADLGFMAVGALITFPVGIVYAAIS
jgi:VanZ family protein